MPGQLPHETAIREALVLRRFALVVLGGAVADAGLRAAVSRCGTEGWTLFLRAESAASPLVARLKRSGAWESLAPEAQAVLERAREAETRRVLAARAQLWTLDALGAQLSLAPVVIKGGAHLAAGGEALDLGDVDVVLPPAAAGVFFAALVAGGYVPEEGVGDDEGEQHLPALVLPGGTKVEVHRHVEYASGGGVPDDEVRALFGFRTLRHGVGPETVLTILRHSVVSHPHRRGHLRDLVLLSAALGQLGRDGVADVRRLTAGRRETPELDEMLAAAAAVDGGSPIEDSRSGRLLAARKYEMTAAPIGGLLGGAPQSELGYVGFERAATGAARLWQYVVAGRARVRSRWHLESLEKLSPALASGFARVARVPGRLAVSLAFEATIPAARWRARRRVGAADRMAVPQ